LRYCEKYPLHLVTQCNDDNYRVADSIVDYQYKQYCYRYVTLCMYIPVKFTLDDRTFNTSCPNSAT